MAITKQRLWDRMMRFTKVDPKTGCYLWTGPHNGGYRGGLYGKISMRLPGRKNPTGVATHKLAGDNFNKPIRAGLEWSHQCHQSLCWNPKHLKAQTHEVNCRDREKQRKLREAACIAT